MSSSGKYLFVRFLDNTIIGYDLLRRGEVIANGEFDGAIALDEVDEFTWAVAGTEKKATEIQVDPAGFRFTIPKNEDDVRPLVTALAFLLDRNNRISLILGLNTGNVVVISQDGEQDPVVVTPIGCVPGVVTDAAVSAGPALRSSTSISSHSP